MTSERDVRLTNRNTKSEERADRADGDRSVTEDRQTIDKERLEQFRRLFVAEKLPNLPKIPGFHTIWLTTTNNADPMHRRMQMGYILIKSTEIPGYDDAAIKEGPYAGVIGCSEMVAAKLPMELYELYMTEAHHTQPLREEERLRAIIDVIEQEAARKKARIEVEEGSRQLGRRTPKPKFADVS